MLTLPEIIDQPARRYVAVRRRVCIPFGDMVAPAYDELFAAFAEAGVQSEGLEFIKYNVVAMPNLEIEIGITADARLPLTGTITAGVLPAGRYARLTYTGPYEQLMDANRVLIEWAKENGIHWDSTQAQDGEHFAARLEVYENNPSTEPAPAKLVTTLLFKIADPNLSFRNFR